MRFARWHLLGNDENLATAWRFDNVPLMFKGHHWDYFLALEEDLARLARYIHFSNENLKTYSIEFARLLMASTQEVDALFRQICANNGSKAEKESEYRAFFSKGDYVKMREIEVSVRSYGLTFTPFKHWISNAPTWWTANNKIKHERHAHFQEASLENVLNAMSALLIANIYFSNEMGTLNKDMIPTKLLLPRKLIRATVSGLTSIKLRMPV